MKWMIVGLLVIAFSGSLLAVNLYTRLSEHNPLKYPLPQAVLNAGPLKPGDAFIRYVTKCNDSKEAITIKGSDTLFVRLDASGTVINTQATSASQLVLAGGECLTRTFSSPIPALEPGTWRLQGRDCVLGTEYCRSWFTGGFTVAE